VQILHCPTYSFFFPLWIWGKITLYDKQPRDPLELNKDWILHSTVAIGFYYLFDCE